MNWNPERVLVYRKSREALRAHHLEAIPTPAAATGAVRRQRIGIWDLNASAGSLPHLLDAIEDAQGYFSFYSVEAAFQTALTTPGEHVAAQWKGRIGDRMSPTAAEANVCASPIFEAARPVLTALPLDWLVVVVRSMTGYGTVALGFASGGGLVGALGVRSALIINASTFVLSGLLVASVSTGRQRALREHTASSALRSTSRPAPSAAARKRRSPTCSTSCTAS